MTADTYCMTHGMQSLLLLPSRQILVRVLQLCRGDTPRAGCLGVWLSAAFFNHSCSPNAAAWVLGETLIVRAAQPVARGQGAHALGWAVVGDEQRRTFLQFCSGTRYWLISQ